MKVMYRCKIRQILCVLILNDREINRRMYGKMAATVVLEANQEVKTFDMDTLQTRGEGPIVLIDPLFFGADSDQVPSRKYVVKAQAEAIGNSRVHPRLSVPSCPPTYFFIIFAATFLAGPGSRRQRRGTMGSGSNSGRGRRRRRVQGACGRRQRRCE